MKPLAAILAPPAVETEVHDGGSVEAQSRTATAKARPATLADVARVAGVSTATVSRAFNRPDTVREGVRQRVQAAAIALQYIPNDAARALASHRSRVIGAIVPTIDNAIFAQGVAAIQGRVEAAGYALLLAACDYDLDRELAQARTMISRGIEALVLVGTRHHPALRELLREHRIAHVCQGAYAPAEEPACVGFDNRRAAYVAARYLLHLGHRRIGMVAGIRKDNDRAEARVAGVRDALAEVGLTLTDGPAEPDRPGAGGLVESSYDYEAARSATRQLLLGPRPPTALVCGNDVLALGALRECQARGVAVPGEVSIIGFDDLAPARQATPALTTIRVPTTRMGEAAADFVLAALAGGNPAALEIPFKLVIRASTGPAPGEPPRSTAP
jgi:LacI family transcriptional regulator